MIINNCLITMRCVKYFLDLWLICVKNHELVIKRIWFKVHFIEIWVIKMRTFSTCSCSPHELSLSNPELKFRYIYGCFSLIQSLERREIHFQTLDQKAQHSEKVFSTHLKCQFSKNRFSIKIPIWKVDWYHLWRQHCNFTNYFRV